MGKTNTRVLMQFSSALAVVLTAAMMIDEANCIRICNVDTKDLQRCLPAVTGNNPPRPGRGCCAAVRRANLQCLCPYLPRSGIDPSKLKAVLANCRANNPSCLPRLKN